MDKEYTLSSVIPGYPLTDPQDMFELWHANFEDIQSEQGKWLRSEIMRVVNSRENHFVSGPWSVLDLISKGYVIHPWEGAWKTYALRPDRQVMSRPTDNGHIRYVAHPTRILPKADELPPLPSSKNGKGYTWLVVYGGSPEVLSKPGVARGLSNLIQSTSVADIVFYEGKGINNPAPTLWSVRAGKGVSGVTRNSATAVAFPDEQALMEIGQLK